METMEKCLFPNCEKTDKLSTGGLERINSIISASISRQDTLHIALRQRLTENPDLKVTFHRSCVSTYTSKTHIGRERKRLGIKDPHVQQAKKRRSHFDSFEFKKHCLFCGSECLPKDPKHPDRWRRVIQCQTKEMKQQLLEKCKIRGDSKAEEVRVRIHGSMSDLHAADAQYHNDCYKKFISERNVAAARSSAKVEELRPTDVAFDHVIQQLNEDA